MRTTKYYVYKKNATNKQKTGQLGENIVVKKCNCPKCKRKNTLRKLPANFKCADIICDFCGYLAQVKTSNVKNENIIPDTVLGAAWKPQKERMKSGIFFPFYLVLINNKKYAIYYLSADLQEFKMFKPRKKLSKKAKRKGWQGYIYNLRNYKSRIVKIK